MKNPFAGKTLRKIDRLAGSAVYIALKVVLHYAPVAHSGGRNDKLKYDSARLLFVENSKSDQAAQTIIVSLGGKLT